MLFQKSEANAKNKESLSQGKKIKLDEEEKLKRSMEEEEKSFIASQLSFQSDLVKNQHLNDSLKYKPSNALVLRDPSGGNSSTGPNSSKVPVQNSFWIPEKTPSFQTLPPKAPSSNAKFKPICTIGNHPVSLKDLSKAVFSKDSETSGNICFGCKKNLSNNFQLVCNLDTI